MSPKKAQHPSEGSSQLHNHSHSHGRCVESNPTVEADGAAPRPFMTSRRILNLFLLRVFMSTILQHCADVPDEWWQSTEVAYHNVFGRGHLPWEWSAQLRSYIYPLPFELAFRILKLLGVDTPFTVWLVPKLIASLIAVGIDVQTYNLGSQLDRSLGIDQEAVKAGKEGITVGKIAFLFSIFHWFTGYIGVRTQSNVLEALLVITAIQQNQFLSFLFFAGFGCALRMTCVVPLTPVALIHVFYTVRNRGFQGLMLCCTELVLMVGMWLLLLMSIDFMFYDTWTLTPWNFVKFNVLEGHSAIFGTHPWHWYFSTAFPVVALPYTLILPLLLVPSFWRSIRAVRNRLLLHLTSICFTMAVYSFVPHKELRFFYPVVPIALVICAFVFVHHPWIRVATSRSPSDAKKSDTPPQSENRTPAAAVPIGSGAAQPKSSDRQPSILLFAFFVFANIATYLIISVGYRRGTIDVMAEIRNGAVSAKFPNKTIHSLHILTGCYATPGYSYIHGRVEDLRLIDCTPKVQDGEVALTERDVFVNHPGAFVQWAYDGISPIQTHNIADADLLHQLQEVVPQKGSWSLPDVIIAYAYAADDMNQTGFFAKHGYTRYNSFYHTFYVFQEHESETIDIWTRTAKLNPATPQPSITP